MKTYEYRGFDMAGRGSRGLVEALSIKNARERLAADGILAERLALTGRKLKLPLEARSAMYRELGALLAAGIPLDDAFELLMGSEGPARAHNLIAGMRDKVREGASLADALGEASDSVTPFERSIVEAAERSATVESMLDQLADFLDDQQNIRERVQAALIYPSIVVTVGICVAILMLGLLIPRAGEMAAGAELPALTVFMVALGAWLKKWGLLLLAAVAAGIAWFRARLRRLPLFRRRWERCLLRLPLFGKGYGLLVNLRFCRTLAILIRGGVSIMEAFSLAGRATGSRWVAARAAEESESLRHGSRLSDAVARIAPLAESVPGWIRVGEAGGDLARLLEHAGTRYQNRWDRFVRRTLSFVEPAIILVIGGFVLLVTLAVLLPVISLTRSIGG